MSPGFRQFHPFDLGSENVLPPPFLGQLLPSLARRPQLFWWVFLGVLRESSPLFRSCFFPKGYGFPPPFLQGFFLFEFLVFPLQGRPGSFLNP